MVRKQKTIKTPISVAKDNIVDLNHIKYSLGLKSYAEVVNYLIEQEASRNE